MEHEEPEAPPADAPAAAASPAADTPAADEALFPRRSVLVDLIAGTIGVLLAIPLAGLLFTPVLRRGKEDGRWVELGPTSEFTGGSRKELDYQVTEQDGWLFSTVRRRVIVGADPASASGFVVFSSKCTHLGCGVRWDEEAKVFRCPCHGGIYNAEGKPIDGPPPRPLARLATRVTAEGRLEVRQS